jgi:DNA-binding NarL/FixJ family response regulator
MRILLADDHTIVRDGIKMLLTEAYPFAEVVDVSDSVQLLNQVANGKWDVIISDISMPPGDSGLEAIKKIKEQTPETPVIILSMHSPEQYAVRAIQSGASAYLTKGAATLELVNAVNQVIMGKKYLTPDVVSVLADAFEKSDTSGASLEGLSDRETEVFLLMANGKTISEIAQQLSLSTNTVSTFRSRIFEKMGFQNNLELIKYAVENKIV